jgi:hypothetical protein
MPLDMKENAKRLLAEVRNQLNQFNIQSAEIYESNVIAFLDQCSNDLFLKDAIVKWDNEEEEFDFLWDTSRLDCRFSVSLKEATWHFWAGINTHNQDDKCYQHDIGGMDIEGNEYCFARDFFEAMSWEIDNFGKYKK